MRTTTDYLRLLIAGMLVRELSFGTNVHCSSLQAELSENGHAISYEELLAYLHDIVSSYPSLGLTWDGESRERLHVIPGVHWWTDSDAYLAVRRGNHERLSELFADVSREVTEHRIAHPRLLVGGGVAPFHCLVHRSCHLAENAREILTNNLFVSQALRTHGVRLLSGEWDLRTGALVNCTDKPARMEQFLSARQRRPDLTIMSFDAVLGSMQHREKHSKRDEPTFFMETQRESQLKLAAFSATKIAVFLVIEGEKIGRAPMADAPCVPMSHLVALQNKAQHATRDIYVITDLKQPAPEQQQVIDLFASKHLRDHRIWLISPNVDTRRMPAGTDTRG